MRYKLSDVVDIIGGGTPKRSIEEYWNGNIPWISIKDFSTSRWIEDTIETITDLGLNHSSTKILNKDDLIISARGTVGLVAQLKKEMAFNQSCYGLKAKKDILLNEYLYYWLKQNITYIKNNVHGSVFDTITRDTFDSLVIEVPELVYQKKVVSLLSPLDSKIELNNQMIATLEELAAVLFKRWFVDFEFPDENGNPYKSSGGKMMDSELGEIPEGWQNGTLSDIGEIVGGGTPSKKMIEYYIEGNIPWITPKDLSEQKNTFISNGKTNITELGLKKSSAKMIPEKSVLFSSRAPIGYIAISTQPVSTNQGFKSIIPKKSKHYSFVYLLLKSQVNNIESRATGSTFKEVSGTIMKNFPIILPKESILNDFSKLTDSIFKLILNLEVNVNNLEQTRNLVLPKLLSGELEV